MRSPYLLREAEGQGARAGSGRWATAGWPGLPGNKVQQRPTGAWNWGLAQLARLARRGAVWRDPAGRLWCLLWLSSWGACWGTSQQGPLSPRHPASALCLPWPWNSSSVWVLQEAIPGRLPTSHPRRECRRPWPAVPSPCVLGAKPWEAAGNSVFGLE